MYKAYFSRNLFDVFTAMYQAVSREHRAKMDRMLQVWRAQGRFDASLIDRIEAKLGGVRGQPQQNDPREAPSAAAATAAGDRDRGSRWAPQQQSQYSKPPPQAVPAVGTAPGGLSLDPALLKALKDGDLMQKVQSIKNASAAAAAGAGAGTNPASPAAKSMEAAARPTPTPATQRRQRGSTITAQAPSASGKPLGDPAVREALKKYPRGSVIPMEFMGAKEISSSILSKEDEEGDTADDADNRSGSARGGGKRGAGGASKGGHGAGGAREAPGKGKENGAAGRAQVEAKAAPVGFSKAYLGCMLLNVRHENVVDSLYGDQKHQCMQTGQRFREKRDLQSHLDLLYQRKKMQSESTPSRKWLVGVDLWKETVETIMATSGKTAEDNNGGDDSGDHAEGGAGSGGGGAKRKKEEAEVDAMALGLSVVAVRNCKTCPLSGESFQVFYNDDDDEWHFRDALKLRRVYQGLPSGSAVLVSSLPSDELKWTLDQMVAAGEISLDGKRRKAGAF